MSRLFNWWKEREPEVIEIPADTPPGTIVPVSGDPKKATIVKTEPEPDLSTKPDDVVGYCFGFVCPKKHVHNLFESATPERFKERRACNTCGAVSKPAVVRKTAEAMWGNRSHYSFSLSPVEPSYGWYNSHNGFLGYSIGFGDTLWNKYEFVHFLDDKKPRPRRRKK